MVTKTTKMTTYATQQRLHLEIKEKQKSLRMQAEQAQLLRQKKEATLQANTVIEPAQ